MKLSKKAYIKKKANPKEATHWEGKYFCDCRTRNIRKWLGVKLYGQPERLNPETCNHSGVNIMTDIDRNTHRCKCGAVFTRCDSLNS